MSMSYPVPLIKKSKVMGQPGHGVFRLIFLPKILPGVFRLTVFHLRFRIRVFGEKDQSINSYVQKREIGNK
jgi:hypothetical protein